MLNIGACAPQNKSEERRWASYTNVNSAIDTDPTVQELVTLESSAPGRTEWFAALAFALYVRANAMDVDLTEAVAFKHLGRPDLMRRLNGDSFEYLYQLGDGSVVQMIVSDNMVVRIGHVTEAVNEEDGYRSFRLPCDTGGGRMIGSSF